MITYSTAMAIHTVHVQNQCRNATIVQVRRWLPFKHRGIQVSVHPTYIWIGHVKNLPPGNAQRCMSTHFSGLFWVLTHAMTAMWHCTSHIPRHTTSPMLTLRMPMYVRCPVRHINTPTFTFKCCRSAMALLGSTRASSRYDDASTASESFRLSPKYSDSRRHVSLNIFCKAPSWVEDSIWWQEVEPQGYSINQHSNAWSLIP